MIPNPLSQSYHFISIISFLYLSYLMPSSSLLQQVLREEIGGNAPFRHPWKQGSLFLSILDPRTPRNGKDLRCGEFASLSRFLVAVSIFRGLPPPPPKGSNGFLVGSCESRKRGAEPQRRQTQMSATPKHVFIVLSLSRKSYVRPLQGKRAWEISLAALEQRQKCAWVQNPGPRTYPSVFLTHMC